MAALLGVHDHRLPELVSVAAIILGLPEPSPLKRNFDFRPFGFWEEFLYRELTLEHLRDGINNGFWRIDKPLVTDFSWEVIGASIRFEEKGQLVCLGRESGVRIQFNTLINPLICFYKLDYVNLRGANIIGKYSQASEQSSIIVHESNKLNISKCKFETVGARALAISTRKDSQESNSISDTLFTHCGNKNLVGGAVAITSTKAAAYTITDCQFHQCSAFIGGGLYARYLGKLHGCSFFNCASQSFPRFTANEYDFLGVGDGVFANETNIPKRLFKCEFSNCGLNLGVVTYRFSSSNGICYEDQDACYNSVFNNSHATYYIQDGRKLGFRECEFDPGEPGAKSLKIDQDVMLSNYTETYWSTLIEKWEEDFEKSTMIAGGVTAGRVVGPNLGSWITAKLFD
jgi:hypothetical protein